MKKQLKQGARLWVFWFHPEHQPSEMEISEATFIQFDDQGDLIYESCVNNWVRRAVVRTVSDSEARGHRPEFCKTCVESCLDNWMR